MKIPLTKHLKSVDPADAELIRLTLNGNTDAFNLLVQKYQPQIYNLIYRKVRDPEISKDLCQVAFLKAWRALPNFKGESTFYNWLYRIAVNCSIDFFRREKNQIASVYDEELSQNTDNLLQMTQVHLSPCEILEKKELAHVISKAVDRLSVNQRCVFDLRHGEELMIKEIALRLNKSEGTIKTHLYNAHKKLRDLLRPYLENKPFEWYRGT